MSPYDDPTNASFDDDILYRARRRLVMLKAFYGHLAVYVAVNGVLHLINLVNGHRYWAIWPLLGWGIAIAIQAASTFQWPANFLGPDWEARKFRELAETERRRAETTRPPPPPASPPAVSS